MKIITNLKPTRVLVGCFDQGNGSLLLRGVIQIEGKTHHGCLSMTPLSNGVYWNGTATLEECMKNTPQRKPIYEGDTITITF